MEQPIYHRLQRGETLEALSARYRVPVCMIVRANGEVRPEALSNGRMLTIPHPCCCGRSAEAAPSGAPPRFKHAWYVVRPDDTLYGIAQRSGLTMRILQKANNLSGMAELQPGTRLRIPVIRGKRYYVRDGEDLTHIALSFGVSEGALREKNFIEAGEGVGPGACLLI
jgi:FOG: LysM repeat